MVVTVFWQDSSYKLESLFDLFPIFGGVSKYVLFQAAWDPQKWILLGHSCEFRMLHLLFGGKAALWCHHNSQVSCIYKIFKQRKSFGWTNLETNCYDNLIWIHKPYRIWLTWLTKPYLIKHLSHYKAFIQLRASQLDPRMDFPPDLRRLLKNGSTKAESVMPRVEKTRLKEGMEPPQKRQGDM